ncbi:MAG: class I SAM-dependent methyltransferase [Bacteroidota bacterium]
MKPDTARIYDSEAEATGWLGPEITFGLTYKYITAGDTLLDLGIGTGLGSVLYHKAGLRVFGMDSSDEMLKVCEEKGFAEALKRHDLGAAPYPFEDSSMDHVVSVGVLHLFRDLATVFQETSRIVRDGGLFAFVVADRGDREEGEIVVGPEQTRTGSTITMYRHSEDQIDSLLLVCGFALLRSLEFPIYMDRERTREFRARAYVTRRQ